MQILRYSINVTLDGCCHHEQGCRRMRSRCASTEQIADADAALRPVHHEMMESAWRRPADELAGLDERGGHPLAETIDRARKRRSSTLTAADWNAELIEEIWHRRSAPGRRSGGPLRRRVTPRALAELG